VEFTIEAEPHMPAPATGEAAHSRAAVRGQQRPTTSRLACNPPARLSAGDQLALQAPSKRISTAADLRRFHASGACKDFMAFILALNDAVTGGGAPAHVAAAADIATAAAPSHTPAAKQRLPVALETGCSEQCHAGSAPCKRGRALCSAPCSCHHPAPPPPPVLQAPTADPTAPCRQPWQACWQLSKPWRRWWMPRRQHSSRCATATPRSAPGTRP